MESRRITFKESELTTIHKLIHQKIDDINYQIENEFDDSLELTSSEWDLYDHLMSDLEVLEDILVKTI